MIYEKIRKLAIAKGVSIYRVEKDTGLSNGAISKWGKTANQTPSSESLKKVANYFKVSMEYLLENEKQEVQ
ncbi:helix-turn-helix domain-containing protein [Enterococcus faecium]|uniref:helix-turn-helix domain-containing protein n=1 Tax=Enterococcus faecium TaxID=1352 RepID=UPI00191379A6|nr:helix-turn-helix transcriptional regulator [Enterococcus faecium]MBK5028658.1 helix-turn-helix transcriptional regulator [Enterococcus faecium]MBK5039330.1 helix-turn-helix transcriptional regulator [Enterococcus faecium]MBK5044418.1 helix-turn-helix transcriptional regulator [Enterococcus faecium]MBK5069286.1 helix-turn-helix transcriptional regulator [Enterococcus faecium]MBK5132422.1 helix-turn-helix transcriptional regulator [Enterococcus faecium]